MNKFTKYLANDPSLKTTRMHSRELCNKLNSSNANNKNIIYSKLFKHIGDKLEVWNNFFCEFGNNISLYDDVFINVNCVMLDSFDISIGNRVAIGPNVGFYTTNHSIKVSERKKHIEYGAPIVLENDVWVGGNVVFLPGVTIGEGSAIGAGCVINKDIPPHSIVKRNNNFLITIEKIRS